MFTSILYAVIVLCVIGILAASILYFVAQKFKVIEDPLIDEIAELLPGANCGGCGYAGCRGLAEAITKAGNMDGLRCPAGGDSTTSKIAALLGVDSVASAKQIAIVRCAGSPNNSSTKVRYEGYADCRLAHDSFAGEGGCPFGCLGLGNCVKVCSFDAIQINPETNLPVVNEGKCTSCGACVKTCPRNIIEIRDAGVKNRKVFVSCVNKEKGAEAKKNCNVACIACLKCQKICPFEAITIENNLAYIDFKKCKLCRKCVTECPTHAIIETNFPLKKSVESLSEES